MATTQNITAFRRKQGGFSLLELLAVVAIIGLAVFTVMKVKKGAELRSSVQSLASNMAFVIQKAPEVFPSTFAGLTCPILANNGAFTGTSFRVDRTVPNTPVVYYSSEANSALTCAPANMFGTNDAYTVAFPALTDDMCNEVADKLNASAWVMMIDGAYIKSARGAMDSAYKGVQCTSTSNPDERTLVATFGRSLPPQ